MTDSASDSVSASASNVIRIDGVLLLTGVLGLGFLVGSWVIAIEALVFGAFGAYFAMVGNMRSGSAGFLIIFAIICALFCGVMRWIARGLLEGRKARAIVACVLMIGIASLVVLWWILGSETRFVLFAFVALVLSLLLIVSFRDRLYWGRAR